MGMNSGMFDIPIKNKWEGHSKRTINAEGLTVCPNCEKAYLPDLDEKSAKKHFKDVTPCQREQLISGLCSDECWDKYDGPKWGRKDNINLKQFK